MVKNMAANAGDARDKGSIPGSGRSLGVGNGNPLQYSCPGNPTDRGAWRVTVHGVAKSQTQLSARTHTHTQISDKHPTFQKVWMGRELKNSMSESMWVQSLVRELRSCKPHGAAKKEKNTCEVSGAALGAGNITVKKQAQPFDL